MLKCHFKHVAGSPEYRFKYSPTELTWPILGVIGVRFCFYLVLSHEWHWENNFALFGTYVTFISKTSWNPNS